MTLRIEFLSFEGCPHADAARSLVREVAAALYPTAQVAEVNVTSPQQAKEIGFLGSPSIRVAGRDIEGLSSPAEANVSCRLYGESGEAPRWMIEAAILRALGLRSYLFLCEEVRAQ